MKKGFTLIELLSVIVILAIIATIAVPIVLNIVEETRNQVNLRSIENILDSTELYITRNIMKPDINLKGNIYNDTNSNIFKIRNPTI